MWESSIAKICQFCILHVIRMFYMLNNAICVLQEFIYIFLLKSTRYDKLVYCENVIHSLEAMIF